MSRPALELLDDYWFFSNTLGNSSSRPSSSSAGARRTPSLPPPGRVSKQDDDGLAGNQQQQDEDDDLNWSSIYEGVLRTRMAEGGAAGSSRRPRPAALRRAPSMPVPGGPASTPSSSKPTPSRKQQLARSRSSMFHDNKCRSSGDLESIEVQGFRDLGFVFHREDLRDSKSRPPPATRAARRRQQEQPAAGNKSSPPALLRVQSEAEVKDQLRMWAQAVACNVRQDC